MRYRLLCLAGSLAAALVASGCPTEPINPIDQGDAGPDADAADAADADADADGPHGCQLPFIGDPMKDIELELLALTELGATGAVGTSVTVKDGDSVALILPPQGGRVIFAGVRAKNVDPCGVKLGGVLRDETTKQVRLDIRTVNLQATGDGWGGSSDGDISSFANVPVCSNSWSKTNIYGTEYELSVSITERGGRTATKTAKVIPTCSEPDNLQECMCICKGGYVLGETCDGMSDGGP